MVHCSIGIMAYNEEANIGCLLDALLSQVTKTVIIDKIFVVASGCTDRTEEIVEEFIELDPRVVLLVQAKREGKASAVNLLLTQVDSEVVVLESADTLPAPQTIESLVSPFADPEVGMVGGHPVPTNSADDFMGWGIRLLWELHHQVSLRKPKMGELIAFRNIFRQIPFETAVDEASIEPLIIGQGMRLVYSPQAVVLNKGPENVQDFIKQRRRIYAGHLYVHDTLGYKVSTMNGLWILLLFLREVKLDWRNFIWGPAIITLELYVRWLATYDYVIWKRKPYSWSIVESTKGQVKVPVARSDTLSRK
jgi:poly-beta-1,6-N-acetyl-D-glucosamine synthase